MITIDRHSTNGIALDIKYAVSRDGKVLKIYLYWRDAVSFAYSIAEPDENVIDNTQD